MSFYISPPVITFRPQLTTCIEVAPRQLTPCIEPEHPAIAAFLAATAPYAKGVK